MPLVTVVSFPLMSVTAGRISLTILSRAAVILSSVSPIALASVDRVDRRLEAFAEPRQLCHHLVDGLGERNMFASAGSSQ